ncbi:MAG: carbohydrate ABC transporter, N-acetylglucosamine/diacetylchitobiose-binding protein [Streptosporangiales bacterium]|nr:carbohydrate ABC transporter, N-acetylglucosamine/diacetylchitobiose-binding protein [Streptosporangiales bacterium]
MRPATLVHRSSRPDLPRREVLRRAFAAGVLVTPVGGVLASCATAGGGEGGEGAKGKVSRENPLGVDPSAPLEVVIFDGGYGEEYAKYDENIYRQRYPEAKIEHSAIQRLQEALQPRFVAGNPPDVIDNSGSYWMDIGALVADKQLTDLSELLDAPSLDISGKKVRETLRGGVEEFGKYGDTSYVLDYAYNVYGLWYSSSLFREKGWQYPRTWTEMLDLCEEIQRSTDMAAWTYQGQFPQYFHWTILSMAAKVAGPEVLINIDNLEPNAWKQPALGQAVEAVYELPRRGYIMKGSHGLSHTEAQTEWLQGKAAFIPSGSWLESEMQDITPDGFDMVMGPHQNIAASDRLPFEALLANPGEHFIVPARGKNARGGLEFLRIMLSNRAAKKFSELTGSLTAVDGSEEGLSLGSGFDSVRTALEAAGANTFGYRFDTWYTPLWDEMIDATGALIRTEIKPSDWMARCQKKADEIAKDDSILKYKRQPG